MEREKIKKAYKHIHDHYDSLIGEKKWYGKLYTHLAWKGANMHKISQKLFDALGYSFSGTLLDVPVGTGIFTGNYYTKLPNATITCVDFTPEMLEQAKRRFERKGIKNVSFMEADVSQLPFEDHSFDVVLCMNGFPAFPDKEKAHQEIYRVLKKGGILMGTSFVKNEFVVTDAWANYILPYSGFMTPPYDTLKSLQLRFIQHYEQTKVLHDGPLAYFVCKK